MIIFLFGEDSYRSQRKLKEIINHYEKINKSGFNLKVFDLTEKDFQDFKTESSSISIFKEKKFIVLRNTASNKNFKEEFIKSVKKFADSEDIILFYETRPVLKDKFFESLKKHGKSQEFNLLGGEKLRNWIEEEFENFGAKITALALDGLIEFVGNDLWQMENEIKKLVNLKKGKEIELDDVKLLVKPKIDTDIFKTIDSLAVKNKKQALKLIHKHLEKGDSPAYLLSMINFQFRNLLMVKSDEFNAGKLKLHPYVIRKTREQARIFSLAELKKIYQKIFKADLDIKTGKIKPETALDLLISEI